MNSHQPLPSLLHSLQRSPLFKDALISFLWLTVFNTMIAFFVYFALSGRKDFIMNWVGSMLIGNSINLLIRGARWIIWRERKPHKPTFIMICLLSSPIGFYIGNSATLFIYGKDVPSFMTIINHQNSIAIVLCFFFSLFGGIFFWNQSERSKLLAEQALEKARTAALERQAMQAQLQLLQAQIEPHMLFNTLANLQGLIAIDTTRAQYMLEQLITYLRASLSSSRVEKTTLKHEFELMHAYLELLAIRMGKRLRFTIDLPPELADLEIAPMLIQPLVENAIKHGLEPKMEGGTLHVSASLYQEQLQISVIDTGLGLASDYQEKTAATRASNVHSHIGNANVHDRLLAIYGEQAKLSITNNPPQGVRAQLSIPLHLQSTLLETTRKDLHENDTCVNRRR
jgi:sensor histidine kinase YesM